MPRRIGEPAVADSRPRSLVYVVCDDVVLSPDPSVLENGDSERLRLRNGLLLEIRCIQRPWLDVLRHQLELERLFTSVGDPHRERKRRTQREQDRACTIALHGAILQS